MTGDATPGIDGEMITFRGGPDDATAADGTPLDWGPSDDAAVPTEMTPDQRRRDFIRTLAAAGMLGIAGCTGGNGSGGNGSGGAGTTTTAAGGNGAGGSGGNGTGQGGGTTTDSDGGADGDRSPGSGEPMILDEDAPFVLPAGTVDSTFDVDLTPETVMLEGSDLDAVLEVDPGEHRYVLDAARLSASGLSVSEGSILWLSGVAMRRVSGIQRDGDRLTVETEFAALNEAISDGEVAWDAELGYDADQVVTEGTDGSGSGDSAGGGSGDDGDGSSGIRPLSASQAALVDVTMLDRDGAEWPVRQFSQSGQGLNWTFKQDNREYTFGLTPGANQMELKAEVKAPVSGPVAGNPNIRLTGIGRLKKAKSTASASFSGGDVSAMDYEADQLAGEAKIDIVSAGSGAYDFKWDFPGAMFKWVIFVGALPVTVTVATALVAKVLVPAKATAKAVSKYSYDGKAGFSYDGTDVEASSEFAGFGFNPDSVDSSAYIGVFVDLQFGVMFPKMSVSIFGTFLVPYLSLEMYIGSKLKWGPVCKEGYVRMVSAVGYDLTVLGVSVSKGKEILEDRTERTSGDSCGTN